MHEQLRFLCLPQNLPTPLDETSTKRISRIRRSIIRNQNRDGSFGGKGLLERQVTTSQIVLALSALGDHRDVARVRKALKWLAKDKVISSEYSYWSLAPFNCVDGYDEQVDLLFRKANDLAEAGVKHHENSPLPNFVSEQANILGKGTEFTKNERLRISGLIDSKSQLQKEAAHVVSHTLLVGVISDVCNETHFASILEILVSKGEANGEAIRWPGNIASTCYILVNLVITKSLSETTLFDEIIERAYAAIVYAVDHGEVLTTLPAGGQFEKPAVYTFAVVLRALVRYWSLKKGWRRVSITGFDYELLRKKQLGAMIGICGLLAIIAWFVEPALDAVKNLLAVNQNGSPDYWETLDRVANVLSIIGEVSIVAGFIAAVRFAFLYFRV